MIPPTHEAYLRLLEPWVRGARRHLYRIPGRRDLCSYGIGNHGHWAIQANTTAFAGFATLATASDALPERAGMTRDELYETALAILRFVLGSHASADGTATDGESWGHSWISALAIERMMHAVEMLGEHLSDRDVETLNTLLVSEADWLMDHYDVAAGLVDNNKPESNMWNGALLHRVARMVPDTPRADEYLEKGTVFLTNAISVPADAESNAFVEGRRVGDLHVGANFFDTYACNHHHYLNVGYMVITLSNAAMLHFSCLRNGWEAPDALYHHVRDLWPLVKTCTFPDGRLLRIGGDTRVRYCYCQDYAIPVWLMMNDLIGDRECETFENGWLQQVALEQQTNQDGSCLGGRLRRLETISPLYYTRLEGDKAASLSMGASFRRLITERHTASWDRSGEGEGQNAAVPLLTTWSDQFHGACMVRGTGRVASWVWEAAEKPQGLCLPPDHSSMAEWRQNLAGHVAGLGLVNEALVCRHTEHTFTGGFATAGRMKVRTRQHVAEGEHDHDVACVDLAFAALPDDATVVGLQRALAPCRVFLRSVKGLYLQIPNDLFNGSTRVLAGPFGSRELPSCPGFRQEISCGGRWLTVDDCLSVLAIYGGDELTVVRPAYRQVTVRSHGWQEHTDRMAGSLYAEEICLGATADRIASYDERQPLFDIAFAVRCGIDAGATEAWADSGQTRCVLPVNPLPDVRVVVVAGADAKHYLVAANFGDRAETVTVELPLQGATACLETGERLPADDEGTLSLDVQPSDVRVVALG